MEDDIIVDLYWRRDESAISETDKKYGNYLAKAAYNILYDFEDSRECVNDTYFKAWNSIPPHKPCALSVYLSKIVRQLSIDTFRKKNSKKRGSSQYVLSLSELEECVTGGSTPEQEAELQILTDAIAGYLRTISEQARNVFVCRYFFMDSIKEIAAYNNASESKIKSMLHRTRIDLKEYLEEEGFVI